MDYAGSERVTLVSPLSDRCTETSLSPPNHHVCEMDLQSCLTFLTCSAPTNAGPVYLADSGLRVQDIEPSGVPLNPRVIDNIVRGYSGVTVQMCCTRRCLDASH